MELETQTPIIESKSNRVWNDAISVGDIDMQICCCDGGTSVSTSLALVCSFKGRSGVVSLMIAAQSMYAKCKDELTNNLMCGTVLH